MQEKEESKDNLPRFRQVHKELEFYKRHNEWEASGARRLVVSGEAMPE